jgi:hypothetical protein
MNILSLTPRHLIFRKNNETTEASTVKNASKDLSGFASSWKVKILPKEGRFLIRGPK